MKCATLKIRLLALCLFAVSGAVAQTAPEDLVRNRDRAAGIYHSYEYLPGEDVPAPKGYEPFYISHYGRHGSRYHISQAAYEQPLKALRKAAAAGTLTPRGEEILAVAEALAEDARLRYGDLSPRGVGEHRGIAERMFAAYPEVFSTARGRECLVECRSTLVPRCILSMSAFSERLKELNPAIRITRDASARYLDYMANGTAQNAVNKEAGRVADSVFHAWVHPERVIGVLTTDPSSIGDPDKFVHRLFNLLSIMQDASHLGLEPFYDLFTDEELYDLWAAENVRRYLQMGPSARFGEGIVADARPLLRNIVETAQEVIDGKLPLSASLRFGHDTYIIPLLALMGVEHASARESDLAEVASVWSVERVSPMAANLQLVFFRHPKTGDVRVRVLHNEHDANLPIEGGPYYPWPVLKAYFEALCQ